MSNFLIKATAEQESLPSQWRPDPLFEKTTVYLHAGQRLILSLEQHCNPAFVFHVQKTLEKEIGVEAYCQAEDSEFSQSLSQTLDALLSDRELDKLIRELQKIQSGRSPL